jgi:hypothetical protein
MNWQTITRIITAFSELSTGLMAAKSPHGEGGAIITNTERVAIAARVAGVWADDDGQPRSVEKSDLIAVFEASGWQIKNER